MKLIVLVGPPGSGKSTYCSEIPNRVRISQDEQGKNHLNRFKEALERHDSPIVIDRMGFSKEQRNRYIEPARKAGYEIEIVVFHVPRQICFTRIMSREGHPTINGNEVNSQFKGQTMSSAAAIRLEEARNTEKARQANSALDTFFTKYERVEDSEADKVTRLGWAEHTGKTKPAIIIDLDGTLCNIDHRLKHVKHEIKKHNRWDLFNKEIPNDKVNDWCKAIYLQMSNNYPIIFCSGRVDSSRPDTENWLTKHEIKSYRHLFMRHRSDFRQDYIIKEIILDFEILPRFQVLFAIDDRKQVVDLWRRRGITCLACAEGDF